MTKKYKSVCTFKLPSCFDRRGAPSGLGAFRPPNIFALLNKSLLLVASTLLGTTLASEAAIRQGIETIDLSRTGRAKASLVQLQEQMERLDRVNRRIGQLPELSRHPNDYELIRKHAGLVEIQARCLLSIRRLASNSADTLGGQLDTIDRIAEKSWDDGSPITGTEHDDDLVEHYHFAFASLDAGRFRLQDGIVRLRLLAFAADTKVKEVLHIAVSNRQALTRDFSDFRITKGQQVEVNRSKDYSRSTSEPTRTGRPTNPRTFVRSY